MKYKLYSLILLQIISHGFTCVHAQSKTQEKEGRVTLNIVLYPIQTLVVNAAQKEIDLEYRTIEDYQNGVTSDQQDHLTISSTGGFDINVAITQESSSFSDIFERSDIKISTSKGSSNELNDVLCENEIVLSTTSTGIVKSKTGGIDQTFNVIYESAGDDAYINHSINNTDNPQIISSTVTYSIIAQ